MASTISCVQKKEQEQQKPNILLLCIDDLRPELNTYGASHIHSPNIDNLAAQGIQFNNHYVNAPSCGPSRYTLLTGTYGSPKNDALFKRAELFRNNSNTVSPSMPEWFKKTVPLPYLLVKFPIIQLVEVVNNGMIAHK